MQHKYMQPGTLCTFVDAPPTELPLVFACFLCQFVLILTEQCILIRMNEPSLPSPLSQEKLSYFTSLHWLLASPVKNQFHFTFTDGLLNVGIQFGVRKVFRFVCCIGSKSSLEADASRQSVLPSLSFLNVCWSAGTTFPAASHSTQLLQVSCANQLQLFHLVYMPLIQCVTLYS